MPIHRRIMRFMRINISALCVQGQQFAKITEISKLHQKTILNQLPKSLMFRIGHSAQTKFAFAF